MSRAKKVKNVAWHCSAGFGDIHSIQAWWKDGLGWKSKGYSIVVDLDGTIWYLKSNSEGHGYTKNSELFNMELITNGVRGYNTPTISCCTIGGVSNTGTRENPIWKANDNRTRAQIESQHKVNKFLVKLLAEKGKDVTKDLGFVGHRDYSIDNNKNGVIESYERIKECPSYDVIPEFGYLYGSKDRYGKLPTVA